VVFSTPLHLLVTLARSTGGLSKYQLLYRTCQPAHCFFIRFVGNGQFCIKICNPAGSNEPGYCQHTLDRIGLAFNCPSKYTLGAGVQPGDFEVCDSDNMVVPGIYTDSTGATQSYAQPPESAGPITTVPYAPTSAASSNCVKMTSSAMYTDAASFTGVVTATSGAASPTGAPGSQAAASGVNASKSSGSGSAGPKATGASGQSTNGAASVGFSAVSLIAGVFAAVFFA
jgi:hypothetical protein